MMVDGSPRRIATPQADATNNSTASGQAQKSPTSGDPGNTSPTAVAANNALGTVLLIPGVGNHPGDSKEKDVSGSTAPSDSSTAQRSSRSRWLKLRTTVQLSGAITQVHKKPPLKREDSFLKRFSTRHITDPCSIDGSSRRGDSSKGTFLGSWRSVVNPDENILFWWLSVLTVCLLYNAWTIIARQAFPELQKSMSPTWYAADGFSDVVFILDIAFQFRTGYLEQGLMVYESRKLAGHYFKSKSFLMDIAAVTPLDLLQLWVGIWPLIRFPRFLKVYRSFRFYYMVESRTIYPNLWRVVNLIHILLLLAHWFGCFYYMLSELEGFNGEWSYPRPVGDYGTLPRKYLGSVYWSTLTLTTIGDLATPATNLQYLFTIVSYLIGVFIFATIVGQVGNVITNRNASRLEFERLLDGAKLYMRHHKVPRNMQRRVQRWYDYSWSRGRMQGGGDINSALGILPDKLKTELALHVNLKTLKKVSIFQECQPEFLHDLVLKMKAYIFTPGDLICRKGEVAREMFIIADGVLEVISETGKVLTQMKAGDFFGEIGILNLDGFNRRTADVRSVGYSELFSLSREDILTAMKDYPEAQEILQTMGRKRLMEARLAANIGKNPKEESQGLGSKRGVGSGAADQGKRGSAAQKPRTAVSKLKEDVRSLKKLLRSRSTPTGKACLPTNDDQVMEMKAMPGSPNIDPKFSDDGKSGGGRRKASLKTLMRKIHLKGESQPSQVSRSFANRLSSIKSRLRDSGQSCSITSRTDSSASIHSTEREDANSHLNKALPLLQRIRLLGEQEKSAGVRSTPARKPQQAITANSIKQVTSATSESDGHEIIGEGLPLLERLKLLRAREQAQASAATASVPSKELAQTLLKSKLSGSHQEIPKPQFPLTKKPQSVTSRIVSVIGSRANLSPPIPAPHESRPQHPLPLRSEVRPTEFSPELPLLKKVLLMKMMEDNKPSPAPLQSESNENFSSEQPPPSKMEEPVRNDANGNRTSKPVSTYSEIPWAAAAPAIVTRPLFLEDNDGQKASAGSDINLGKQETSVQRSAISPANKTAVMTSPSDIQPSIPLASTSPTGSKRSPDSGQEEDLSELGNRKKSPVAEESEVPPAGRVRKDSTTAELIRSNTIEGYSARKAKLSRMMALREDSDEHGSDTSSDEDLDGSSDDPFVKNIECQTEVHRSTSTSPDTWSPQQPSRRHRPEESPPTTKNKKSPSSLLASKKETEHRKKKGSTKGDQKETLSPSDDGIQDYLIRVMKNVKHVVKCYVLEQQQELQNRIIALEKEVREKDALIRQLKTGVYGQNRSSTVTRTSSTFDEVSSLDVSSFSSSDSEEINSFLRSRETPKKGNSSSKQEMQSQEADDEDDILGPEEEALLQMQRPTSQRKSWTYGGCDGDLPRTMLRRRMLLTSRQSYSLDDEKCQASVSPCKTDELWKLEFPFVETRASSSPSYDGGRSTVLHIRDNEVTGLIESVPEDVELEEEEEEEKIITPEKEIKEDTHQEDHFDISEEVISSSGNDWEVQMLVQQFEKNIRQKRRHSSGEMLSWQAVLGSRVAAASSSSATTNLESEQFGVQQQPAKRSHRKLSLVESNLPQYWDIPEKPVIHHRSMWQLPGSTCPKSHMSSTTCLKTKLSPGENIDITALQELKLPQNSNKLDKKTNSRRRAYRHRRQNSFNEFKLQQHPRKSSLPSVDALRNVSVSKWTSLENTSLVQTASPNSRDRNVAACDTVLNVDPRFGSLEDVSTALLHKRHPWPRSPSSPNFPTDRQFWDSGTAMPGHGIPEWPSSPCLPTITEDDHSVCPSLTSSPCRSFSHDCLPSLPPSPLWQVPSNPASSAGFWTASGSRGENVQSDSLQRSTKKETSTNAKRGVKEQPQLPLSSVSDRKVGAKSLKDIDDSRFLPFAQSREDSVVIAIPECEPLLSPR